MFYVYLHLTADTHQVYHVGKGKGDRAWRKWGRNTMHKNVEAKHGQIIAILHENLAENEAFFWEKFYIRLFGMRIEGNGPLTNMTAGGEGSSGRKMTPEHKAAMARGRKGIKQSESHRQSIAKSLKAYTKTTEHEKNVHLGRKINAEKRHNDRHRANG